MSVIRKKIEALSSQKPKEDKPLFLKGAHRAFNPIGQVLTEIMGELTQRDFEIESSDLSSTDYETAIEDLNMCSLFCSSVDENETPEIVIGFERGLSALITSRALKTSKLEFSDYKISRLDMTLFKSIFELTLNRYHSLLNPSEVKNVIGLESLSIEETNFNKNTARQMKKLARLNVTLICPDLIEELTTASQPSEKKATKGKAKPKTKSKTTAKDKEKAGEAVEAKLGHFVVTLVIPEAQALEIVNNSSLLQDTETASETTFMDNPWNLHMRETLKDAPTNIRVVVESFRMSVADCTRLAIGQVIPLPGVSLQSMGVEVEMEDDSLGQSTHRGQKLPKRVEVARATLGIYKTNRAVKLIEDLDQNFVQDMASHDL